MESTKVTYEEALEFIIKALDWRYGNGVIGPSHKDDVVEEAGEVIEHLNCGPDEVEFGMTNLLIGEAMQRVLVASGELNDTFTHMWVLEAGWLPLDEPIMIGDDE